MSIPEPTSVQNVKIVSFDMWLTIIGKNETFNILRKEMIFNEIAQEYPYLKVNEFEKAFKEMKRDTEHESERRNKHMGFEERINHLLFRLNAPSLNQAKLLEIKHKQYKLAKEYIPPLLSTKIPTLFKNITKAGKKIAIISNTGMLTSEHVKHYLNAHGLKQYISYEIYSDETGYTKPSKETFNKLIELSGAKPTQIIHIGDNRKADVEGALNSAMHASLTPLTDSGVIEITKLLKLYDQA